MLLRISLIEDGQAQKIIFARDKIPFNMEVMGLIKINI
jgi:hypothetical protein